MLVKAGDPVLDGVPLTDAEVLGIHLVFGHLELGKLTREATPRHDGLKPAAFPQRAVLEQSQQGQRACRRAPRASASPAPCTFRIRAARCRSRNLYRASRSVAVANSGAVMPADATRSRSASSSPLSPGQGRASRLSPGVAEAAWPRRPGTLSVLDLQRVCQAGYGRVPGGGDGASPAGFSSGRSRWPKALAADGPHGQRPGEAAAGDRGADLRWLPVWLPITAAKEDDLAKGIAVATFRRRGRVFLETRKITSRIAELPR